MLRLLKLLNLCRTSSRLIQSVAAAFVLSIGVAIAAPAVHLANLSPDQQIICLGSGGMKLVTFAADGSVSDVQNTDGMGCPLCMASGALPAVSQVVIGQAVASFAQPVLYGLQPHSIFESRAPPARAPPSL